jgi:hypothetical protein
MSKVVISVQSTRERAMVAGVSNINTTGEKIAQSKYQAGR